MKRNMLSVLLLVMLSTSCSSASIEVPTMTPVGSVSNAVKTVDRFLILINNAQNAYDFNEPWNMLTPEEQCGNPRDMCTMFNFGERLMKWKAVYRLFDCSSNLVLAEEFRYPREDEPSSASTPQYWKYQVIENDDVWLISDIYRGQSLEGDCFLAIDNSTSPD